MAYTPKRISAWIDDQLRPDYEEVEQALVMNDISRQPSLQSTRSELNGTDSVDYWGLHQVLEALEQKMILPLIVGPHRYEEARDNEKKLGNQRQAMRPAKVTHMLNSRSIAAYEQSKLLDIKTLFHVARTNFLSSVVIRSIIPSNIAINTPEYTRQYDTIKSIQEDCYQSALGFVVWAVGQIGNMTDDFCGPGFFAGLDRRGRCLLFATVFRQFPAWTMWYYRARESEYVNFREIFSGAIRRRDLVQKKKWRAFFEYGFVHFCNKVFLWQQGHGDEELVKEAWLWIDRRERVRVLGVGGVFDLPAVAETTFEKMS